MKLSPYPMGAAPASQAESSKPVSRQTVAGDEASLVPLRYFQVP